MRGRRRRLGPSLNQQVESFHGEEYVVRRVSGSSAAKEYRCPGCDQVIRPATPHVVAWPVQAPMFVASGLDVRRHWHTACWQARERRR